MHLHQDPYVHYRPPSPCYGSQFSLDAYTHAHRSRAKSKTVDILTDLSIRRSYPCFTEDWEAVELTRSVTIHFIHIRNGITNLSDSMQGNLTGQLSFLNVFTNFDTDLNPHHLAINMGCGACSRTHCSKVQHHNACP